MNKKINIPAIHDNDLKEILEKLNLLEQFEKGNMHCINCNKRIDWNNLFALKVLDNKIVAFCDEPDCIENSNN